MQGYSYIELIICYYFIQMSDLINYPRGLIPTWFQAQLSEKEYKIGDSIEFPRIFAEDHGILEYVQARGWAVEYINKRGKPHRLVKDAIIKETIQTDIDVSVSSVPTISNVTKFEDVTDVPYVPEIANEFPDVDYMRDQKFIELEEYERQDRAFRNFEQWHHETERNMLEAERQKIIRRGRLNTLDEIRMEELDILLGPVVIPERELVDYW